MAESTLALSKAELDAAIGDFLGYGRGASNGYPAWSQRQQDWIDTARRGGLRAFYTASAGLNDGSEGYQWSFLRPRVRLLLSSGAQTVALPDDYHGLEGRIAIRGSSSQQFRPMPVVGMGLVQESYSKTPTQTGTPQLAAIEPLRLQGGSRGQRFQLLVFPLADQDYTLEFVYFVNCDDISDARPYPYGGAQHAETITAACLAAAEQKVDDANGVQSQRFREMLLASILVDRRNKPQLTGYCGDGGEAGSEGLDVRRGIYQNTAVSYDGANY